jgi:molybdopterin molybdotransferase
MGGITPDRTPGNGGRGPDLEKIARVGDLISIEEARRLVLETAVAGGDEDVSLDAALGRVLAEDVSSPIEVPPFDSSGMDGYAVVAGPEAELTVVGEARAGHPADRAVQPGSAVLISTGAALPEGADAVVPIERTTAVRGVEGPADRDPVAVDPAMRGKVRRDRILVPRTEPGANVRRAGEDIPINAVVLRRGAALGPAELGVAASVGRGSVRVALRPKVAVLVTGDELTPPGDPLPPGGIYSSNGFALAAQVERAGAALTGRTTVPDDPEGTRAALAAALDDSDVVVVSGGVSVGPHDHVRAALRELGVEERFWGVSLRPGKPTWFGARDGTLAFGLPGNPVSAMVTFQLFARPALAALQGAPPDAPRTTATLTAAVPRNPEREQAVRVRLRQAENALMASPTGPQGSHMLTSMLGAEALALIAPGEGEAAAGDRVEIELL